MHMTHLKIFGEQGVNRGIYFNPKLNSAVGQFVKSYPHYTVSHLARDAIYHYVRNYDSIIAAFDQTATIGPANETKIGAEEKSAS